MDKDDNFYSNAIKFLYGMVIQKVVKIINVIYD